MSLPARRPDAEEASPIAAFLERSRERIEEHLDSQRIPPEDTAELLGQALVMLVYRWEELADPDAWLVATLRNHCQRYWRRRGGESRQGGDGGGGAPGVAVLEDGERPQE